MARICFPYSQERKMEIKSAVLDLFLKFTQNRSDYSRLGEQVEPLGITVEAFKVWVYPNKTRSPSLEHLLILWEMTGDNRFVFTQNEIEYGKRRGLCLPSNYPQVKERKEAKPRWTSTSLYSRERLTEIGVQVKLWLHTLPSPKNIESCNLLGVSYNTIKSWIVGNFGPKAELMYKLYLLTKDDDSIKSKVFIMSPREVEISARRKTGVPDEMRVLSVMYFRERTEVETKPEVEETVEPPLQEVQPEKNIDNSRVLRTLNLMLISNLSSFSAFRDFVEMFDIDSEKFNDNQRAKAVDLVKTLIEIFGLKVEDFISVLVDDEIEHSPAVVQILQALSQQSTAGGEQG